jgi:cytochrome c oxidase assembly protein subunit 11
MQQDANRTARKLALFAVAMFGFGYALVPLYDVFCEVVGINGKTGAISQAEAEAGQVDMSRMVTVEFDTNINSIPWDFQATTNKTEVHPGEIAEVMFVAENRSDRTIVGRAVPSVAPTTASLYFNKTECFCFSEQVLKPGEKKEMPVRFVVGSGLPEKIKMMTLSYTFFEVPESEQVANYDKQRDSADNI